MQLHHLCAVQVIIARAMSLVAIREAAFLCAHYAPAVALQSLTASYADVQPVLDACSRSISALERYCAVRATRQQAQQQGGAGHSVTEHLARAVQARASQAVWHGRSWHGGGTAKGALWTAAYQAVCMALPSQQAAADAEPAGCVAVVAHREAFEHAFAALRAHGWRLRQLEALQLETPDGSVASADEVRLPKICHCLVRLK
jgi:hypothetical protein